MSNLTNNTQQLEALLAKINELPEGGSGGAVCTVTVNDPGNKIANLIYQNKLGEVQKITADPLTSASGTYNVVSGTLLDIIPSNSSILINVNNLIYVPFPGSGRLYLVTAQAGESADLTVS